MEFGVKTGPITMVGIMQDAGGRLKTRSAEGEFLPGAMLKIGNTNSRLRRLPPDEFVNRWREEGPAHHCALGVGHRLEEFPNSRN